MNAVTIWLVPLLIAVAVVLFATGGVVVGATRSSESRLGFGILWGGVAALVAAALAYVLPMIVLTLGARPA